MVMNEQTMQHALKLFAECEYDRQGVSAALLAEKLAVPSAHITQLIDDLQKADLITDRLELTTAGREYAMHVLQAHRLYETYLAKTTGLPDSEWHRLADEREHSLTKSDVRKLAEELGHPRFDPHGDPIPSSTGEMPEKRGNSLAGHAEGWTGRVVHIEDEPPSLYSAITAAHISTDSIIRIEKKTDAEIRLYIEGETFTFPSEIASQITVVELGKGEMFDESVKRLSSLRMGESAEIVGMSSLVRGLERNRLLDLGIVPGTVTAIELINPSGSPAAYRIRGASIALRKEQADRIRIRRVRP
jgi:DtxR family Mn-dependent transcriptional regulator